MRREKAAHAREVVRRLVRHYGTPAVALHYSTPWELLVAVILSAQCTDARVNLVTASLFRKYRSLDDYAQAEQSVLEQDIHSTGFFRNKAKNIIAAARLIRGRFNGKIPDTMEEILEIPGVARKTANIVLGNVYGVVEGIAVDTHVIRIAQRLGLSSHTDPVKIEQDLMALLPRKDWFRFSYLVQSLGRTVCVARSPQHGVCVLRGICPAAKI